MAKSDSAAESWNGGKAAYRFCFCAYSALAVSAHGPPLSARAQRRLTEDVRRGSTGWAGARRLAQADSWVPVQVATGRLALSRETVCRDPGGSVWAPRRCWPACLKARRHPCRPRVHAAAEPVADSFAMVARAAAVSSTGSKTPGRSGGSMKAFRRRPPRQGPCRRSGRAGACRRCPRPGPQRPFCRAAAFR